MKNKLIHFAIAGLMFVLWLIPFLMLDKAVDMISPLNPDKISASINAFKTYDWSSNVNVVWFENITLLLLGLGIGLYLSFSKNTIYALETFIYIPFIFSHPFDGNSIPTFLFVAAGLALLGMIIHLIRFKVKIKVPKLFISFVIFALGLMLGGITTKADYLLSQFLILLFASCGLLALLIFFNSTVKKPDFKYICDMLVIFGVFLVIQGLMAVLIRVDFILELVNGRKVNVGWGMCNNIGVVLLLIVPIPFYYIFKDYSIKSFIIGLIAPLLFLYAIVFFMSKGSVMMAAAGVFGFYLIAFIYFVIKKQWKRLFVFAISLITALLLTFVVLYLLNFKIPVFKQFKEALDALHFDTLNGRVSIYKKVFERIKEYPLFGVGLWAGFDEGYLYEGFKGFDWCHSTLLQALYSGGLFGLGCMLFHLFFKYFYLIKKMTVEKIIVGLSFLISGLYGLFDVSYFFISYMIVFIVMTIFCDDVYQEKKVSIKKQLTEFDEGYKLFTLKKGVKYENSN